MSELIITTKQDLSSVIEAVLIKHDERNKAKQPERIYTINYVAKKLGKHHATIKKLVDIGTIRSTKSGLIPESAINDYLGQ